MRMLSLDEYRSLSAFLEEKWCNGQILGCFEDLQ